MNASRPRYRVLFDLAEGGMGVVSVGLLQSDRGFQRVVALKRIHREVADDDSARRALLREAHLASLIRDPGIVQVHELVEQDGELLVVMELVEGVSLRMLLTALEEQHRKLPVGVAVRILAKCARALEAAHEATDPTTGASLRVVHRDVSPQNVLVSFRGAVKITDFGIAKALEESGESTKPGMLRGKPAYVAPEQVMSREVDARTDLWSLGVVGHELFTGTRLFRGRTDPETLDQLLHAEIPALDTVRGDVPRAVAAVIDRALQRDPSSRWPSARAMAQALENAAGTSMARRDDVAELLGSVLGDEQRVFTERVRRAMADPPRDRAPSSARSGGGSAGASRYPLRFIGFMAIGLAAAAALRVAIGVPGTMGADVSDPAANVAPVAEPRTRPELATDRPAGPAPRAAAPSTAAAEPRTASPEPSTPIPAIRPAEVSTAREEPAIPEIRPRTTVPPARGRPVASPPPRTTSGATTATPATTRPAAPPTRPAATPATPPAPTRPATSPGTRPAWMEFPL